MQFVFLQIPVASAYGHKGSKEGFEAWPDGLTAWAYEVGFDVLVDVPEADVPSVEDDPATGDTAVGINSGAFTQSSAVRLSVCLQQISKYSLVK